MSQFSAGPGGVLSPKSPTAVATGTHPVGVAVSPDGSSVYVTNLADNTVSEFNVGSGGVLSAMSPATVATGVEPRWIAASPDGTSVYVTNSGDLDIQGRTLSEFSVGAGGALSPKNPATVATGDYPQGIGMRPSPEVLGVSPGSGPAAGGTSITIRGTGFLAGDGVEIGQGQGPGSTAIRASHVQVVSPTEITATTGGGANPGTWDVYVFGHGLTSPALGTDVFTYGPVVSGVSPSSGPAAGGTSITITGSGFAPGATVQVGSGGAAVPASSVDVVSPTEITAVTGAQPRGGSYYVFVSEGGATSPFTGAPRFAYTGVPVVSGVSPSSGPASGGTPITITGSGGFAPGAKVVIAQGHGAGSGAIPVTHESVRSSTEMTAVTGGPAQPGAFNLFVTVAGKTSAGNGDDIFTYTSGSG